MNYKMTRYEIVIEFFQYRISNGYNINNTVIHKK